MDKDSIKRLGAHLRKVRTTKQLTAADIVSGTGKDVSFVSKVEVGSGNPTIQSFEIVANAMGLRLEFVDEKTGLVPSCIMDEYKACEASPCSMADEPEKGSSPIVNARQLLQMIAGLYDYDIVITPKK